MANPRFLTAGDTDGPLGEVELTKTVIESICGPVGGGGSPLPFDSYFTVRKAFVRINSSVVVVSSGVTDPGAAGATTLWSTTVTPSVVGSIIRVRAIAWLTTGAWDTNAVHLAIVRDGVKIDQSVDMGVACLEVLDEYPTPSLTPVQIKINAIAGGGGAARCNRLVVSVEELIPAASPTTTKDQLLALLQDSIGDVMPRGSVVHLIGQYPVGYSAVKTSVTLPTITTDKQRGLIVGGSISYSSSAAPFRIGNPFAVKLGNKIVLPSYSQIYDIDKSTYSSIASGGSLYTASAIGVADRFLVLGTTNLGMKVYDSATNVWIDSMIGVTSQCGYGFPAAAIGGNNVAFISGTGTTFTVKDMVTNTYDTPIATPDGSMIYALWTMKTGKMLVIHGTTTSLRGSIYDPATKQITQIGTSQTLASAHPSTGLCIMESDDRVLFFQSNGAKIFEWMDSTGWVGYALSATKNYMTDGIQQGLASRLGGSETQIMLFPASSAVSLCFSRCDAEPTYSAWDVPISSDQASVGDATRMTMTGGQAYNGQMCVTSGAYALPDRYKSATSAFTTAPNVMVFQGIVQFPWMRDMAICLSEGATSYVFSTKTGQTVCTLPTSMTLTAMTTVASPKSNPTRARLTCLKISDDICMIGSVVFKSGLSAVSGYATTVWVVDSNLSRNLISFQAVKD